MDNLTIDGGSLPETPACANPPEPATDPELDRALARAIRRLIAIVHAQEADNLD